MVPVRGGHSSFGSSSHLEHALDRAARAAGDLRRDLDAMFEVSRLRRIFGSVIRFMCGQRLHGRTNSTSGCAVATLSLIEHSVIMHDAPRAGRSDLADHAGGRADVVGRRQHVRRTLGVREHEDSRVRRRAARWISRPVKRSCTSQCPFQSTSSTGVCVATYLPRYSSGRKITFGTPSDSTTSTAFAEVQQMSDSALTSAEVLT